MTKVPTPDREMMNTPEAVLEAPSTFAACLNAHGLYNTLQFVLRLSPRIHQILDAIPSGVYTTGELDREAIPQSGRASRSCLAKQRAPYQGRW